MAGREDILFLDKVLQDPRNICEIIDLKNAIEAQYSILLSVEKHTLVIINEDHKMPRDRIFIFKLVRALRAKKLHALCRRNIPTDS